MSGSTVHLTYTPILFPRRRDYHIMDCVMSKGTTTEDLLSISRVRGLLCSIFVSDIVTVNGKYLKEFATTRTYSREHASIYKFPKEIPTQEDWITWRRFWKQYTVGNFELSTPLGEWIHPTHRVWEWYYDEEGSSLQQHTSSGTCFYVPAAGYVQQNKMRKAPCEELGIKRVTRRMPDLSESNHSNTVAPERHRPQNGSSTTRPTILLGIS